MNRRQAKKVFKNWMRLKKAEDTLRSYHHQIGPEGQALRDVMSKFIDGKNTEHRWAKGWWPQGKIIHDLGIGGSFCKYSRQQVASAYRRLSPEDRLAWHVEMVLLRTAREALEKRETDPWGYATQALSALPLIVGQALKTAS